MRECFVVAAAVTPGQLMRPLVQLRRHLYRLLRRAAEGYEHRRQFTLLHRLTTATVASIRRSGIRDQFQQRGVFLRAADEIERAQVAIALRGIGSLVVDQFDEQRGRFLAA